MKKYKIYCTKIYEKSVDGKWVHDTDESNNCSKEITHEEYDRIVSNKTTSFFRSLGGTETVNVDGGGRVKRLVSMSPACEKRVIYLFKFVNQEVV